MISINSGSKLTVKKKKLVTTTKKLPAKGGIIGQKKRGAKTTRRAQAPPLRPSTLTTPTSLSPLSTLPLPDLQTTVDTHLRRTFGIPDPLFSANAGIATPRSSSTTTDRSGAAADLAALTVHCGVPKILKGCGVLEKIEAQILMNGIGSLFGNEKGENPGGGMRKITSCASIASMAGSTGSGGFLGTDGGSTILSDSKRGRTVAPEAREGCLLFLRALTEMGGRAAEPFVVPLLAAALEECSSSSGLVREAAEDTATAIATSANPYAIPSMICPVIFEALQSPEWRVKTVALDVLARCAACRPKNISRLLPQIIPAVTGQVWDTKPQVTKAAAAALLACCRTNINPDVAPAVPAIVNAIMKPSETVKALDELKGTTFVASVDASTLSILCPVLSRGLKDKMALNKRSCCIVIENMSRLVETPEAVAPFGPLLVPDLKRVAENVQFDEIRDAALAALNALTKALGHASVDEALNTIMKEENERIASEQKRIEEARALELEKEEQMRLQEEAERLQWREAMEAQRLLDKMALEEEQEKKAAEKMKGEIAKNSTKAASGKCQGCGLKKCKKTCLFYSG